MKTCTSCGSEKELSEFYLTTRRNGEKARHSKCQVCRRKQFSDWAKTDRGKQNKRAGILRREYSMTEDQYQEMLAKQGGKCAICRQPETKIHRDGSLCKLSVDHDHQSGKVRGLLCSSCNVGLGSFKDDPVLLESAATYLRTQ